MDEAGSSRSSLLAIEQAPIKNNKSSRLTAEPRKDNKDSSDEECRITSVIPAKKRKRDNDCVIMSVSPAKQCKTSELSAAVKNDSSAKVKVVEKETPPSKRDNTVLSTVFKNNPTTAAKEKKETSANESESCATHTMQIKSPKRATRSNEYSDDREWKPSNEKEDSDEESITSSENSVCCCECHEKDHMEDNDQQSVQQVDKMNMIINANNITFIIKKDLLDSKSLITKHL